MAVQLTMPSVSLKMPKRLEPVWCPYCNGRAKLTSSKVVYSGRDYGPIYLCQPCDAWVGCHKGSSNPLGTLANGTTRSARKAAHAAFDPLWNSGKWTRGAAYRWLAQQLQLSSKNCHISLFNEDQCLKVVEVCYHWSRSQKRIKHDRYRKVGQ